MNYKKITDDEWEKIDFELENTIESDYKPLPKTKKTIRKSKAHRIYKAQTHDNQKTMDKY